MACELALHIPKPEELWYRQQLMEDPETMHYNRGYTLPFAGYDPETGCIPFPPDQWEGWYRQFVCGGPERFYAYLVRVEDGVFVGEVNLHKSGQHPWYEIGIVLEGKHRGQGYAAPGLQLLLEYAFQTLGASAVHNDFEETRQAAVRLHLNAGFQICKQEHGLMELLITREQFLERGVT